MSWDPVVTRSEWGRIQVIIDGQDVTFFRGVPVIVASWSSGDPFDDAACVLKVSQISPFEKPGVGELVWLKGHALVDIKLIRPNGSKKILWEGQIASIEDRVTEQSTELTLECIGALYQADYYVRAPKNLDEKQKRLYERAIRDEFNKSDPERQALRTAALKIRYPTGMTSTQWTTQYSGSWEPVLTGYIQRLLADMVHTPGLIRQPGSPEVPGTAGKNEIQDIILDPEPPPWPWGSSYPSPGKDNLQGYFQLEHRGIKTATIPWDGNATAVRNALVGLPHINDLTVTGSGTNASPWRVTFSGSSVREKPQQLIKLYHSQLRHNHNTTRVVRIQTGEPGTAGKPAVPPSDPEPWEGAWTLLKDPGRRPVLQLRNESTAAWTVSAGAPGVEFDLKSDHSQTPNVFFGEGTDESGTTWRNTTVTVDSKRTATTRHWPLAWEESVHPADKRYTEQGELTDAPPPAFSPENVRVEVMQRYGANVSLVDARLSAEQQLFRESEPGWFGTITLRSDPEEGSRFEIKAGSNIRLRHFRNLDSPPKEIYAELQSEGITDTPYHSMPVTRGQFCHWIRNLGAHIGHPVPAGATNQFPDVPNSHTYSDAINALAGQGIVNGYGNGNFGPDDPLRRDQMGSIVVNFVEWAQGSTLPAATRDHFADLAGNAHRVKINRGAEAGVVKGLTDDAYYPANHADGLDAGEHLYLISKYMSDETTPEEQTILGGETGAFLHIAQCEVDFDSQSVRLTVDTKSRDLATLAQIIERVKSENKNPAKMLMVNRQSGNTDDTKFPWDYNAGSGSIPKRALTTKVATLPNGTPSNNPEFFVFVNGANGDQFKRWTVVPVVLAGKGSVAKSEVRAFNSSGQPLAIPFHVGVYSDLITEYSMPNQPFAEGSWDQSSEVDSLAGFDPSAIILWGQFGQRAGYWPGLESEGGSPTGILIDDGQWQFQLPEGQTIVWVAFYAEVNAYFQGRFFHGVQ